MARHRKEPERGLQRTAEIDRGPMARAQPAGQLSIATMEEGIIRAAQAIELKHPRLRAIVRQGLSALCNAWTVYTLKRAIADVAATSEQDYREFGFDKAEILTALRQLSDEIEAGRPLAGWDRGANGDVCRLAILVSKNARASGVKPSNQPAGV